MQSATSIFDHSRLADLLFTRKRSGGESLAKNLPNVDARLFDSGLVRPHRILAMLAMPSSPRRRCAPRARAYGMPVPSRRLILPMTQMIGLNTAETISGMGLPRAYLHCWQ